MLLCTTVLALHGCRRRSPVDPDPDPLPTLAVTTASLPGGTVGVDYGMQAVEATGGDGSYVWSVTSGGLPDGLVLSGSGTVWTAPRTGFRAAEVGADIRIHDVPCTCLPRCSHRLRRSR